jgi:hypothetical protein
VRVDVTDTGDTVWVELGRFRGTHPESGEVHDVDDISVVADPGAEPDAVVSGPAGTLDAWLWRRASEPAIRIVDHDTWSRFRSCVDQPID